MRSAVLAAALLVSAPAFAGTVEQPILGGSTTTVGQYPSVVAIVIGGNSLCTGTLITPEWVMTAAHCVKGMSVSSFQVHFNTVDVFHNKGTVVGASMAIANPGFSTSALGSKDIGLIKLATPVTDIKPVPVNLDPAKAPVGIKVTMVGFGATATGGGGNVGIEYVVDQTSVACNSFAGTDANLLCFSQVSGKGKCEGDSGGPSFAMIDGRMTQVGITSFGDQNCAQFGADTRTDAEAAFIKQNVPNLYCETDADCAADHACFQNSCIAQPFGPGGLGSECTDSSDCDSGTCATNSSGGKCTMGCTLGDSSTCPAGLDCINAGGAGTCWPPSDDTGCCDASGKGAPTMLVGIALVGFVWRRRRRAR